MAQTLGDIKRLLAERRLRPKHRLGQNFLHDANHMDRILAAASLEPGDRVLEVGPGTGALTDRLLDAGAEVVAVELDSDLIPLLTERYAAQDPGRFRLLHRDVLAGKHTIAPEVLAAVGDGPFKLIANLPYQIASPLLVNLCLHVPNMTRAVVMVQREVADRLAATPADGKAYGPLSAVVQNACRVETVSRLSAGCFWPAPKIGSAVSLLTRRPEPRFEPAEDFAAFVHRLFAARRKQLGGILGPDTAWPAGVDRTLRPENLTLDQIGALFGDA